MNQAIVSKTRSQEEFIEAENNRWMVYNSWSKVYCYAPGSGLDPREHLIEVKFTLYYSNTRN